MSDDDEVVHEPLTKAEMARILGSIGGRIGGRSKSAKKAEAARKNGKRGGRPRKVQP